MLTAAFNFIKGFGVKNTFFTLIIVALISMLGVTHCQKASIEKELIETKNLLDTTKLKLAQSESLVNAKDSELNIKESTIDQINTNLSKCYLQYKEHVASVKEIDEIMNLNEEVEKDQTEVVATPNYTPITSQQMKLGLDFVNRQIDRIQE